MGGRLVIAAEPKEHVVARLGRSPDRGDAVVMAYTRGQAGSGWQSELPGREIKVIRHRESQKRRLRR